MLVSRSSSRSRTGREGGCDHVWYWRLYGIGKAQATPPRAVNSPLLRRG
jgi:hypothetical protein